MVIRCQIDLMNELPQQRGGFSYAKSETQKRVIKTTRVFEHQSYQ